MQHEFTDEQIIEASQAATANLSFAPNRITLTYLNQFLDALPEPEQDDFQRGGVILDTDDVRKGDRVLIWNLANNLYEVTVTHVDENDIIWKGSSINKPQIDRIYLLDRPVVHPDPDNNPVILVREVHGKTYDPPVVAIVRDSSTQNHPVYVYGDNGSAFPDYITDWSPAKVVADDENS